jgi:hypothetical protein
MASKNSNKCSKYFPFGLQKTIPKDAKTLQIKSLQGFLFASKHHIMHQNATKMSVIRCVPHGKTLRTELLLIN